jgi:hypothetical protein
MIDDEPIFQVGDLVSRDGTDVHRVTVADDGYGCITVVCEKAPFGNWCKVGDEERNLSRRYAYAGDLIDGEAIRVAGKIAPPTRS